MAAIWSSLDPELSEKAQKDTKVGVRKEAGSCSIMNSISVTLGVPTFVLQRTQHWKAFTYQLPFTRTSCVALFSIKHILLELLSRVRG